MNKYWNVENLFLIGAVTAVMVAIFVLLCKNRRKNTN